MDQHNFFSATLGLYHPWEIRSVSLSEKEKRMDIDICIANICSSTCPHREKSQETSDTASEMWRHDNFFKNTAYLHVRVPHLKCFSCGGGDLQRPWSRVGSKFVLVTGNEPFTEILPA